MRFLPPAKHVQSKPRTTQTAKVTAILHEHSQTQSNTQHCMKRDSPPENLQIEWAQVTLVRYTAGAPLIGQWTSGGCRLKEIYIKQAVSNL